MTRQRAAAVVLLAIALGFVATTLSDATQSARAAQDDAPASKAAEADRAAEPVERDDAAVGPGGDADAGADEEPPLEFSLEIAGKAVDVQLDRPATVEVDGKPVEIRLTAKPDRLFRGGGISFRYPRQHAFEVERDADSGVTTWTFDGNDSVLIFMEHGPAGDAEDLQQGIVDGLLEQYGRQNSRTAQASVRLGKMKLAGTRLDVTLAGESFTQDVFAWQSAGGGRTYVLIVQDSPAEGGGVSRETAQMLELLATTFKAEPE